MLVRHLVCACVCVHTFCETPMPCRVRNIYSTYTVHFSCLSYIYHLLNLYLRGSNILWRTKPDNTQGTLTHFPFKKNKWKATVWEAVSLFSTKETGRGLMNLFCPPAHLLQNGPLGEQCAFGSVNERKWRIGQTNNWRGRLSRSTLVIILVLKSSLEGCSCF